MILTRGIDHDDFFKDEGTNHFEEKTTADPHLILCRNGDGKEAIVYPGTNEVPEHGGIPIWIKDYGLIIRANHPSNPKRIVMIFAGAHSLGTGAACLAATRSPLVAEIQRRLFEMDQASKQLSSDRQFWVLVKGCCHKPDYLISEKNVSIEEVGLFDEL